MAREKEIIDSLDIDRIILEHRQSGFEDYKADSMVAHAVRAAYLALYELGIQMSSVDPLLRRLETADYIHSVDTNNINANKALSFLRIEKREEPLRWQDAAVQAWATDVADGTYTQGSLATLLNYLKRKLPADASSPTMIEQQALEFVDGFIRGFEEELSTFHDPIDFLYHVVFRYLDKALKVKPRNLQKFKERFLPRYKALLEKYSSEIQKELGITELPVSEKTAEEVLLDAIIEIHTGEREVGAIIDETSDYVTLAMVDLGGIQTLHPQSVEAEYQAVLAGYVVLQKQGKPMLWKHAFRMLSRFKDKMFFWPETDENTAAAVLLEIQSLDSPEVNFHDQLERIAVAGIAQDKPLAELKGQITEFGGKCLKRVEGKVCDDHPITDRARETVLRNMRNDQNRFLRDDTIEDLTLPQNFRENLFSQLEYLWSYGTIDLSLLIHDLDRRFGLLIDKYASVFTVPNFQGQDISDMDVTSKSVTYNPLEKVELHLPSQDAVNVFTQRERLLYDAFVAYKKGAFREPPSEG